MSSEFLKRYPKLKTEWRNLISFVKILGYLLGYFITATTLRG